MATAPEKPAGRRRWFRFSLRTLLVLMAIAAVWLGLSMKRLRDRHHAIEAFRSPSSMLWFEDPTHPPVPNRRSFQEGDSPPGGSPWLQRFLGKYGKYVGCRVDTIMLGLGSDPRDPGAPDLSLLAHLPELKQLKFGSRADLATLEQIPDLPNLTSFSNSFLGFGVRELQCMAHMPRLTSLSLMNSTLTAESCRLIAARPNLEKIWLKSCEPSIDGLAHFVDVPNLNELTLYDCTLDDDAIPTLSRLHNVKRLDVSGTYLTREGVGRLRAALPKCEVRWDESRAPRR